MKKLMFALAAVVGISLSSQAAAYYWQVFDLDADQQETSLGTWDGSTIYAVDTTVWAAAIAASEVTGVDWLKSNALALKDSVGTPSVGAVMAYSTDDGFAYTDQMKMTYGADAAATTAFELVVVDPTEEGYFAFEQDIAGFASTDTPEDDAKTVVFNDALQAAWVANDSEYTSFAAPEPTSGLLLLLGVAGLALKRKQA